MTCDTFHQIGRYKTALEKRQAYITDPFAFAPKESLSEETSTRRRSWYAYPSTVNNCNSHKLHAM